MTDDTFPIIEDVTSDGVEHDIYNLLNSREKEDCDFREELVKRREILAQTLAKGNLAALLREQYPFEKKTGRQLLEEYQKKQNEQMERNSRVPGLTFLQTQELAHKLLVQLAPTPAPCIKALRRLVNNPDESREANLRFRIATEIDVPSICPTQRLWTINTNIRFSLGVRDLNLHALPSALPDLPLKCNNACFHSLEMPMLHTANGVSSTISTSIYRCGSVVLIGVRPATEALPCAHNLVKLLRNNGLECSVNELTVTNIVVGFDFGSHLNLTAMMKAYPGVIERTAQLPMCPYTQQKGSSKTKLTALLFEAGSGLIPGVQHESDAVEFFVELCEVVSPYLHDNASPIDNDAVRDVSDIISMGVSIGQVMACIKQADMSMGEMAAISSLDKETDEQERQRLFELMLTMDTTDDVEIVSSDDDAELYD